MLFHRFHKHSDGTRKRHVVIRNEVYVLTVHESNWSKKSSRAATHWIHSAKEGRILPFRWGTYEKLDMSPDELDDYVCGSCGKHLSTRSGMYKHTRRCKLVVARAGSSDDGPFDNPRTDEGWKGNENVIHTGDTYSVENPPTQQTVNVIHNYGNLQNNVTIRELGKENARWLTSQILYEAIMNMPSAVQNLMEKKHFNKDFPENRNLRIHTKRDIDKRISVWENGRWTIRDSKQTFYRVLVDIHDILSEALDEDGDDDDSDSDETDDEKHTRKQIKRLRQADRFINKLQRIRPLWKKVQDKIVDPEKRMEMWEDLKTLLLDRQLALEQGFD